MPKYKKVNILLIVALIPFLISFFMFFKGTEAGEKKEKTFSVKIIDANNTPNIMKAICQDLRDNRIVMR